MPRIEWSARDDSVRVQRLAPSALRRDDAARSRSGSSVSSCGGSPRVSSSPSPSSMLVLRGGTYIEFAAQRLDGDGQPSVHVARVRGFRSQGPESSPRGVLVDVWNPDAHAFERLPLRMAVDAFPADAAQWTARFGFPLGILRVVPPPPGAEAVYAATFR